MLEQLSGGHKGDASRAALLERRAGRLRQEMAEAAQAMQTPEHRQLDAVEEAASRSREILAAIASEQRDEHERQVAARAQMSRDREAFRAGRRPFGGGAAADAEQERYRAACAEIDCPVEDGEQLSFR